MKTLLKPLFELLTGDITIFGNVIYNYIAILIIGEIAYWVAKNFVGYLYDMGAIGGKSSGSIIHWIVRFFAYVASAYLLRLIIWLVNFISSIPMWIWIRIVGVGLGTIIIFIVHKIRKVGENK